MCLLLYYKCLCDWSIYKCACLYTVVMPPISMYMDFVLVSNYSLVHVLLVHIQILYYTCNTVFLTAFLEGSAGPQHSFKPSTVQAGIQNGDLLPSANLLKLSLQTAGPQGEAQVTLPV